ncbi:hypothetical protein FRC02_000683 [Tulasnella sp. 418]|nr:hypothetical protein FRC02_000683 [Tulasnella sp. 418]
MELIASKNEEYSTQEYWDSRYGSEADDATFDWFKDYSDIRPLIRELLPQKDGIRILMVGCGNSSLSEEMWQDGYKNITNIDYSTVVIEKMEKKYEDRPGMEWLVMDARDLRFNQDSFDVVIDKGTMDAMLAVKGDVWNPPEEAVQNCMKEVDEAIRVLKRPHGVFLYLTFGQPHFRKRYLQRDRTSLEIRKLGDSFHYFLYVLRVDEI